MKDVIIDLVLYRFCPLFVHCRAVHNVLIMIGCVTCLLWCVTLWFVLCLP